MSGQTRSNARRESATRRFPSLFWALLAMAGGRVDEALRLGLRRRFRGRLEAAMGGALSRGEVGRLFGAWCVYRRLAALDERLPLAHVEVTVTGKKTAPGDRQPVVLLGTLSAGLGAAVLRERFPGAAIVEMQAPLLAGATPHSIADGALLAVALRTGPLSLRLVLVPAAAGEGLGRQLDDHLRENPGQFPWLP